MTVLVYAYNQCDDMQLMITIEHLNKLKLNTIIYSETSPVTLFSGIQLIPTTIYLPKICDAIFLPGGPNFECLRMNLKAQHVFQSYQKSNKILCVSTISNIFVEWNLATPDQLCCYPTLDQNLNYRKKMLVVSGKIISLIGFNFQAFAEAIFFTIHLNQQ